LEGAISRAWCGGLVEERHPGQKPSVRTPKLQARILTALKNGPHDGSTHWSCRKLASRFGVSKDTVQRILTQADVRPHRLERYLASDDPDFENKAADVIGLYMAPPQHAAVFCVDEKTAIQALDRLDPVLPLSPGRLERHGFEYRRNGTLSLYAALDVKTGKVQGKTAERHTSAAFIEFLEQLVSTCKTRQEIHIILDNLSAHKTAKVTAFLERNPNVKLHFTPTYSSWLNQVEIWFSGLSAKSLRAAFSPPSTTSPENSCATYAPTQKPLGLSSGNTPTFAGEFSRANELAATGH
jgi:transposase